MPNQSFEQALEYYRSQHRTKGCQLTHLFGVPMIAISIPLTLINFRRGLALFAAGWTLQFIGHFYFEKNKPVLATPAANIWLPLAALFVVGQYWLSIFSTVYSIGQNNGKMQNIADEHTNSGRV
jgi:uncharacterized membrane protein YGL010W